MLYFIEIKNYISMLGIIIIIIILKFIIIIIFNGFSNPLNFWIIFMCAVEIYFP